MSFETIIFFICELYVAFIIILNLKYANKYIYLRILLKGILSSLKSMVECMTIIFIDLTHDCFKTGTKDQFSLIIIHYLLVIFKNFL